MAKTVAEVMTPDPLVVEPTTPIQEAIRRLSEQRFSGLPVVDKAGKLVGILSEDDLMWRETGVETPPYIMLLDSVIYLRNPLRYEREIHKALGQTVGEVMTEKPISIRGDRSLREAAQVMHKRKIRRLPVVDPENRVIGIITEGDIVRTLAEE